MGNDEWLDYIKHKEWQVDEAEKGDTTQARLVLDDATIALRGVIQGTSPGADEIPALTFLLSALEKIKDGISAELALGLWTNNRPRNPDIPQRNFVLFFEVGRELDKSIKSPFDTSRLENIRTIVARKGGVSKHVVREAWEHFGGIEGWKACKEAMREKG